MKRTWVRGAMLVACAGPLLVASSAFGAAGLVPGALYTGKSPGCGSSVHGTTCVFTFRAGADGRSLRFIGKPVIDTWGCRGGGGEALLGGKLRGVAPTPIPLLKVAGDGTVSGSVRYVLRPSMAPPNHYVSKVTGHLADAGRTVVITFHDIYLSSHGNQPCTTRPVTLTKH